MSVMMTAVETGPGAPGVVAVVAAVAASRATASGRKDRAVAIWS